MSDDETPTVDYWHLYVDDDGISRQKRWGEEKGQAKKGVILGEERGHS